MTAPKMILETALYAPDLDAAEAFYGELLGLKKHSRLGNRHLFYRVGTSMLLIFNPTETLKPPASPEIPVPPHGATGQGHICFPATDEEITVWKTKLSAAGRPIDADFTWPNRARSLYTRDPAGNSVEFAEAMLWAE